MAFGACGGKRSARGHQEERRGCPREPRQTVGALPALPLHVAAGAVGGGELRQPACRGRSPCARPATPVCPCSPGRERDAGRHVVGLLACAGGLRAGCHPPAVHAPVCPRASPGADALRPSRPTRGLLRRTEEGAGAGHAPGPCPSGGSPPRRRAHAARAGPVGPAYAREVAVTCRGGGSARASQAPPAVGGPSVGWGRAVRERCRNALAPVCTRAGRRLGRTQ